MLTNKESNPVWLDYMKEFDSVPHSERTHAPTNDMTFNVRFTSNHVKDLELVEVNTKKQNSLHVLPVKGRSE